MVRESNVDAENIHIILHTSAESDKIEETNDIFTELAAEFDSVGITFEFYLDADHDRTIKLDNGWFITLGRGLDFFEAPKSRFTLQNSAQQNRPCRPCIITIQRNY